MSKISNSKQKDKEAVLKKFSTRTEKQTLKNEGELVIVGEQDVVLKQLIWDDANKLEDCIVLQLEKFNSITSTGLENLDVKEVLTIAIQGLLRDGLLELSEILTEGVVTLDFIRASRATKNDIIELVVKGIMLNYSYLKNLMALGQRLG